MRPTTTLLLLAALGSAETAQHRDDGLSSGMGEGWLGALSRLPLESQFSFELGGRSSSSFLGSWNRTCLPHLPSAQRRGRGRQPDSDGFLPAAAVPGLGVSDGSWQRPAAGRHGRGLQRDGRCGLQLVRAAGNRRQDELWLRARRYRSYRVVTRRSEHSACG